MESYPQVTMSYLSRSISYEMRKLGTYLAHLREETNLSIRAAAQECGVSPSYLFKIEKGDSFSTLSIHTLLKLSKFYNISIGALLKEAGLTDSNEYELPDFVQYLRTRYHLSPQAIRDLEMAKEIVDRKYQTRRI